MIRRVIIIDGYTDEPAGLGVPPYINTYPRLVAGSIWFANKCINVIYFTIDLIRENIEKFMKIAKTCDVVVVIAGTEVPGKYLGGKPITVSELERLMMLLDEKIRVLIGPAARFGIGLGGGTIALSVKRLKSLFEYIVPGDPEFFFYEAIKHGWEKASTTEIRQNYGLANKSFYYGAKIIEQHPNYKWNLIVEIETFRGCPRYITGGCSFCIEPRTDMVVYRSIEGILKEIEALDRFGAKHYRIGKQPDILAYMAYDTGKIEFPKPNINALRRLFHGIRSIATNLKILHIDNVNPGTIAHNKDEALEALKIIMKYHTPGDVAALGIESFDPKVVKYNNLKVYPDEALEAIRIINRVGSKRGWNGLPELLPGINLLYGLPGESRDTYRINLEYLYKILNEGLLIRRINIRKVTVLENTPLWLRKNEVEYLLKKYHSLYEIYRRRIMDEIDRKMLRKILPQNTIVKYLYTEKYIGRFTVARQPASYPIVFYIEGHYPLKKIIDLRVIGYKAKSVYGKIV